jgi:serine/threonine-protein kinase RsbW
MSVGPLRGCGSDEGLEFRFVSESQGSVQMIRIPADPAALAEARAAITTDLEAQGIDAQTIEEAEIVASELLSNAMRHARTLSDGNIRLRWKVRLEVVEVEVTDGGSDTTPRPAPRAVWASSGRGLRIVRALAHEWGVSEDKSGTTVWAALGGPSRRRAT